jgi:hypothetical protein
MMRRNAILWASIILLVLFAFAVMPAHEYFIDSTGKVVDVDPNAPPTPEWLKSVKTKERIIE